MQDIALIRNFGRDANAERGARFHPNVGSVTPNGFTTSHPRARPRCLRFNFLLSAQRKSRTKVTLLLCSELPVFLEFLSVLFRDLCRACSPLFPPFTTLLLLPFLCKIVCGANFPIHGQVWELLWMGGSPPSPH
jgi:hypothetical protein